MNASALFPSRRFSAASIIFLLICTAPASALIMVGKGNAPVSDPGWPVGAVDVANLKTRVGWWEGPPFGGGQWCFEYRGGAGELNAAVKAFAAIRAPALQIIVHEGPQNSPFLRDDKDPKADTHYDWSFTIWVPRSWHHLYNDPRSTFSAESPNFRKSVDPPRLDVYVTERIDWKKVTLPEGVQIIDQRAAEGTKPAAGAVIRGDVFDMATGKPIAGAEIRVEVLNKTKQNAWDKAASGDSNATGRFELANIPPGHYRLTAKAIGYAPRMIGYEELKDGAARKLTIELSSASKLSGTIADTDGKPIPNVTVRANNLMGIDGRGYNAPATPEIKTDDKGQFTLDDLPTGFAQVWAYAPGWYQLESLKLLGVPETKGLALRMVVTGTIKGKVVDAKGKPASGGTVSVYPPGDPIGKWGGGMNVAADGTFRFDNVPPGPYTVSTKPSYPGAPVDPNAQQITVSSGKTAEVTVKK